MEFPESLQDDLVELSKIEFEISKSCEVMRKSPGPYVGMYGVSNIEDLIKKWLNKAKDIASTYGPESFTISAGFPFGGQVSFTWKM